jgi:hypothetical protein
MRPAVPAVGLYAFAPRMLRVMPVLLSPPCHPHTLTMPGPPA